MKSMLMERKCFGERVNVRITMRRYFLKSSDSDPISPIHVGMCNCVCK